MNIDFPFHFDSRGRTASTDDNDHIRDMIEQLIFTNPGERVNRPDFGSGLLQLIFAPNSPELAATVQFTLQAAIQRWLGDVIEIQDLEVQAVGFHAGRPLEVRDSPHQPATNGDLDTQRLIRRDREPLLPARRSPRRGAAYERTERP